MNIHNAVILVTGANRGLGQSLVKQLLAAGARKVSMVDWCGHNHEYQPWLQPDG